MLNLTGDTAKCAILNTYYIMHYRDKPHYVIDIAWKGVLSYIYGLDSHKPEGEWLYKPYIYIYSTNLPCYMYYKYYIRTFLHSKNKNLTYLFY